MPSYRKKVMGIIRQSRFLFQIPPLLSVVSAFIAARNFSLPILFSVVLSLVLMFIFVNSVNNFYDKDTDQDSQLRKGFDSNPVTGGELSYGEAKLMIIVTPFLSIIVGVFAGPYWVALLLIGILLVFLYDIRPFRLKDTAFGFLIPGLGGCLPFLFAYATATSKFSFIPWVLCIFTFVYFNTAVSTRYLPDRELDLKLGIHNLATTHGQSAPVKADAAFVVLAAVTLTSGVLLGGLSLAGVPVLLLSAGRQLRILARGAESMKNPAIFKKFASGMIPNSMAMALCLTLTASISIIIPFSI